MKKKPAKKNPQDATFRNINALKRRVKVLEDRVKQMSLAIIELYEGIKGAGL